MLSHQKTKVIKSLEKQPNWPKVLQSDYTVKSELIELYAREPVKVLF